MSSRKDSKENLGNLIRLVEEGVHMISDWIDRVEYLIDDIEYGREKE